MSALANWLSEPVTFWDLFDILIVALVVYRILLMIRGTRGAQVLLGLALIGGAFVLSQALQFVTLNWIMTYFVNNIVLILVVLFQGEIRRALAQVGRRSLFATYNSGASDTRTVEEVVRCAATLSRKHVGALIVIARQGQLDTLIESGTLLDAQVSQELLETIFQRTTPLHDGAAVIDHDRVVAAGCVLPLNTDSNVSREFGTRHRAALGLVQDTDALVVVVSEESGRISLASEGEIIYAQSPEELRADLQQGLRVSGKAKR